MLNKSRILIADDHHAIRNGIRLILTSEFEELEVGEARDGVEAIEQLRCGDWHLVILDIDLPEKNGYEVLDAMQKENMKVPVLMFSLHSHQAIEHKSLNLGAAAFLSKDVPATTVLEKVKLLLDL